MQKSTFENSYFLYLTILHNDKSEESIESKKEIGWANWCTEEVTSLELH